MREHAISFPCEGALLLGIVHQPEKPAAVGMVIVVAGGPQYRVGVSRQFVMMARMLAGRGVSVLRFDHRGTGDSGGECRGYLDMRADIKSAIDELERQCPQLDSIVLWGECESASAITFYAHSDPRVSGIFLVNPWIRTDEGEAKAYLKHYYLARFFDKELWKKIASGKFSFSKSIGSFISMAQKSLRRGGSSEGTSDSDELESLPLPQRLEQSVGRFTGDTFIVTSGRDFIAQEFTDYVAGSVQWKNNLASQRIQMHIMEEADHTFSRLEWRDELFDYTGDWTESTFAKPAGSRSINKPI